MALSAEPWQPPNGAVRNAELEAWEVSERAANGVRHGDCTAYRDDGSLLFRCRYESGERNGDFTSYHPNGELESEGRYVGGVLDGPFRRYSSGKPGAAPLRSCCVPPGARELRVTYRRGTSSGDAFFDGQGRGLRSDGMLLPERAPGVPEAATFEESEERWVLRTASEDGTASRTSFDLEGRPCEETEIVAGKRVAFREFSRAGALAREHRFDDDGRLHGDCSLRFGDDDAPYVDRSIREVRGAYEHGQSVGAWRYLDAAGRELRTQSRGEALSAERLAALLAPDAANTNQALAEVAGRLSAEGRIREALFVAARAAARTGRVELLRDLLDLSVVPLVPDAAKARAAAFDREEAPSVSGALDALLSGGEPAELFRSLATLVPSALPAAGDFAEVALLLEPASSRALVTRALVRLEQGDDRGALADAAALDPELADAALQIRELARVLYAKFAFAPALEPPSPNASLAPVAVEQPLDAVRRAISLYATRQVAIRAEVRRRLGRDPEWLPRDLSPLLEAGPVALERFTATITDEDENGSETSDVEIDERLELERASTATLMIVARADWDALSWLCWAAGLDELALPSSLEARPGFAAAVNDAMQRCFRAFDQLRTAGLVSRSRGLASFVWEGHPVETLSSRLAEIAARQYLERRAMFLFLLFPENLSPFQSDLRSA